MANYNFLKEAKVWFVPISETGVEEGLTLTSSQAHLATIFTGAGSGFHSSQAILPTLMAGEAVLPSSFSNTNECLFEHGGSGAGCWIGVVTENGQKLFYARAGGGNSNTDVNTNGNCIVAKTLISNIPEFDNSSHTVSWEFHPTNGTLKLWIDNRPIFNEVTSDKSAFISNKWTGGNQGSWGKGLLAIAGRASAVEADFHTPWSGTITSPLRVYSNQIALDINNQGVPILLDVESNLQFNQTFTDNNYSQKTLHEPTKFFEASNIKKANPADISFILPIYEENDFAPVYECLRELNSNNGLKQFDLYIQLPNDLYYINKCVVKSGSFLVERDKPLRLQIQAQGSQLKRYESTEAPKYTSAFNSLTRSSTKTHQVFTDHLEASIAGTSLDCLFSISAELQNDVEWIENKTIQKSFNIDNNVHSTWKLIDNTSGYAAQTNDDTTGQYIGSAPSGSDIDIYIGSLTWAADRSYIDVDLDINPHSGFSGTSSILFSLHFDSNKLGTTTTVTSHLDNADGPTQALPSSTRPGYDKRFLVDYLDFSGSDLPEDNGSTVTSYPYTMFTLRFNIPNTAVGTTSFFWEGAPGGNKTHPNNITGDTYSLNFTAEEHLTINPASGVVTFNNNGFTTKSSYSYSVQSLSSSGKVLSTTNHTITSTGGLSNGDTVYTALETQDSSLTTIFPQKAILKTRKLAGSVGQYITDSTSHKYVQTHKTGVPIVIKTGKNSTTGFQFDIAQCTFTNRNTVADAFTQSFDWKMNDAGSNTLSSIIKINNA